MFPRRSKKFFSILEVLAAFTLISSVAIPITLPAMRAIEKKRQLMRQMILFRKSEVAWFSILRRETLERFRLGWESFQTKDEYVFDWEDWTIPELEKAVYSSRITFKRLLQTPKRRKEIPWKRMILVRLSVYSQSGVLVDQFDRAFVLEKKNRLSQLDGLT
ncbi:hypothetical protein [Candidatus Similichlamydia epinepheli]|uniref:hypothetical protein n=1 Tax=Candidatus Similichlamydia epinepheli TaxID=1903953 RepID=UPI000D3D9A39|nr:hypothetical protein [Candidatus Similichlamydia epinepheli]